MFSIQSSSQFKSHSWSKEWDSFLYHATTALYFEYSLLSSPGCAPSSWSSTRPSKWSFCMYTYSGSELIHELFSWCSTRPSKWLYVHLSWLRTDWCIIQLMFHQTVQVVILFIHFFWLKTDGCIIQLMFN